MNKKSRIGLAILAILLIIIIISGSYAYFEAVVNKDNNNAAEVTTKKLSIHFQDGPEIVLDGVLPGQKIIKTFSVSNTGNTTQNYYLEFIDVINELSRTSDLVYTLTSTNGGATKSETEFVMSSKTFTPSIEIPANTTQEYTLTIEYKNKPENQSVDMNSRIHAKIQISDVERFAISDDLPYVPSNTDYNLAVADLDGLKTAIDGYNTANSIDAINWDTANFAVFKTTHKEWWDYNYYIDCLSYYIYIYPSNSLTSTWSTNTDFGNFRLEDPNKYITISGDGQMVQYKLISRTIGTLYNGWYILRSIPASYNNHQYFGDKTLINIQNLAFDYSYYENYPVYVSGNLSTTDNNNVTYNFVAKGN